MDNKVFVSNDARCNHKKEKSIWNSFHKQTGRLARNVYQQRAAEATFYPSGGRQCCEISKATAMTRDIGLRFVKKKTVTEGTPRLAGLSVPTP